MQQRVVGVLEKELFMKQDASNPAKFSARTELKAGELKFGTNVYAGFDQMSICAT